MNTEPRLAFVVPGQPIPKERPRVVRGRTYTPPRTASYETLVRAYARIAASEWARANGRPWPTTGRYSALFEVTRADAKPCDLDNLAKSLCDGCIGPAWADDSSIDQLLMVRLAPSRSVPQVAVSVILLSDPVQPKRPATARRSPSLAPAGSRTSARRQPTPDATTGRTGAAKP